MADPVISDMVVRDLSSAQGSRKAQEAGKPRGAARLTSPNEPHCQEEVCFSRSVTQESVRRGKLAPALREVLCWQEAVPCLSG